MPDRFGREQTETTVCSRDPVGDDDVVHCFPCILSLERIFPVTSYLLYGAHGPRSRIECLANWSILRYMRPLIRRFDTSLNDIITSWPISLKPFFIAVTSLGDPIATIAIGLAVTAYGLFQANMRLALAGVIVWVTLAIGAILKLLFGRARPLTEYAQNMHFPTHSFPSGHASGATIAYGLLAYLAWYLLPQPWNYITVAALIALIILVGISRVYLGAHFPSDVVAGWMLGSLGLLVIIFIIRPLA